MRGLVTALLLVLLSACAAAPSPPEPRELTFQATAQATLQELMGVLLDEGYVVRHADAELGRVEAVLARWPGYRILATTAVSEPGVRVSLTATRGGRPLPPHLLDPLLAELQRRLGLAPR